MEYVILSVTVLTLFAVVGILKRIERLEKGETAVVVNIDRGVVDACNSFSDDEILNRDALDIN